jgi:hypothetical protein
MTKVPRLSPAGRSPRSEAAMPCIVGRGHALLLTNLDTWHSKTVRGIGRPPI